MTVFGSYARYYDLLYHDKDYVAESQFIHQLLQTHAPNSQTILDLGCGTGIHPMLLAKAGYRVHGVDLSQEMLERASDRLTKLPPDLKSRLSFTQGDLRQVRLNQRFDVVLSLFHVISYQTTHQDLLAAFTTVKQHLKPGGIFIFDIWYGPAVLNEKPAVRVKRLENETTAITRIAEPIMDPNQNRVDVHYHIFIQDKPTQGIQELHETHSMRYLFQPEIELLLNTLNMVPIQFRAWLTNQEPGMNTWGVYYIAQG